MHIVAVDDSDGLAVVAADRVEATIVERPDALLLAATGDTPMGAYAELARRRATGQLDAPSVRVAQLDEYLGVADDDPRSLYGWMRRALCEPLGIGADRVVRLRGDEPHADAACRTYEAAVRAEGGIDLAVLGLGPNGHLGFNEPPTAIDSPTRAVDLTTASLESNARYWGDRSVPRRALTAGMGVIMAARRVVLLVSGRHKAGIVRRLLESPAQPGLPATWLHRHPEVVLVADRAALDGSPASR